MKEILKFATLSVVLLFVLMFSFYELYDSAKTEQKTLELTKKIDKIKIENLLLGNELFYDFKRQDYDKLNTIEKQLIEDWQKFKIKVNTSYLNKEKINTLINDIDHSLQKQEKSTRHYESTKAIIANSVLYLLKLNQYSEEENKLSQMHTLENSINNFIKALTYFQITKSQKDKTIAKILQQIDSFENLQSNFNVRLIQQHLTILSNNIDRITTILNSIKKLSLDKKFETLEQLIDDAVSTERQRQEKLDKVIAFFSLIMLLGFLLAFFKTYLDKKQIENLQEENSQKHQELIAHMHLLSEYKRALDESSIVSKTDLRGIITYVNEKFCELSGYTQEELIGKPHNIIRHPDMPSTIFQELWKTIQAKKTFHALIKNHTKSGGEYYVDSTVMPILDSHGQIQEYFAVRHDVTELVHAKERALEAEATKSRFLATMSHELRTPLNAVIGFSQILMYKKDIQAEVLQEYIKKINLSGNHLLSLVNDILDFSKLESDTMELHVEETNLAELFDEVVMMLESTATKKNITIIKEYSQDVLLVADKKLLKQVIINILGNAIKFTPEGKKITLGYASEQKFHHLRICDEGIGLSKEQIATIFNPFTQVREHQKEAIKGTGLGLSISKKIIDLHHGKIEVQSQVGKGSCFTLLLPKEILL